MSVIGSFNVVFFNPATAYCQELSPRKNVSVFAVPVPSLAGLIIPLMMLSASIVVVVKLLQLVSNCPLVFASPLIITVCFLRETVPVPCVR